MRSFEAWKRKQLKNPEFKAAYDALEDEFTQLREEIKARAKKSGAKRQKTFGSRSR